MTQTPSTDASGGFASDSPLATFSDAAHEALQTLARTRAQRDAAAVNGAQILFRQVPEESQLETLHVVLSDDAPVDVQMIFCAPLGLTNETWNTLMGAAWKRWTAMEQVFVADPNSDWSGFRVEDVQAFKRGLGPLVVRVAASLGLDVLEVNANAFGSTLWAL